MAETDRLSGFLAGTQPRDREKAAMMLGPNIWLSFHAEVTAAERAMLGRVAEFFEQPASWIAPHCQTPKAPVRLPFPYAVNADSPGNKPTAEPLNP